MPTERRGRLTVLLPLAATLTAMACFQAGAAVAKSLFATVGPLGAVTLRLGLGALMLLAVTRPWRAWPRPAPLRPLAALGVAMAGVIVAFYEALGHLPLGVAIALQFLGPLGVAVFGSRRPSHLVWALLAAAGVWALTGAGVSAKAVDLVGVGWALAAAVGWASYIIIGRRVSAAFGTSTAALSVGIAALLVLPFGVAKAGALLAVPHLIPAALLMALLSTAVPFMLEFYALPRLPARTFATFTSLEPAFGVIFGLTLLNERLSLAQIGGVAAVIAAAAGAAWSSAEPGAAEPDSDVADAPPT